MTSILIGLPCYGGMMSAVTALGIADTLVELNKAGIPYQTLVVTNQSLIPLGRSDIANYFVNATDHTHLMWIDSDIGFSPKDVFNMIDAKVDHVMATYPHKTTPPRYSFTVETNESGDLIWDENKTRLKVKNNVGGFSLIHRKVFEKIRNNVPDLKQYIPYSNSRVVSEAEINNSYHYYDIPISPENGSIMPEDFAFHEKCNQAGIDNWLIPSINLIHNGNTNFTGIPDLHKTLLGV